MFREKFVKEHKTHILRSKTIFLNRAFYKIMRKNIAERGRPQMAIWCMRTLCCIPKATNTHSDYINNIALPRLQWLRERASTLRYTYIACLVLLLLPVTLCTERITGRYLTCDPKYWRYAKILVNSYRPNVELGSRALHGIRGPASVWDRHIFLHFLCTGLP